MNKKVENLPEEEDDEELLEEELLEWVDGVRGRRRFSAGTRISKKQELK